MILDFYKCHLRSSQSGIDDFSGLSCGVFTGNDAHKSEGQ